MAELTKAGSATRELILKDREFAEIMLIGEYEDAGWVVAPSQKY